MHGTRSSGQKMRAPFYRLHAVTLDPAATVTDLVRALEATQEVQDRHRLAEGAVYASACRRYLLETGEHYHRPGQDATGWGGESDHRYRERSRPDGSYDARCSCGAATVVFTADGPGLEWHAAHVAGRVPGQVPS